MSTKRYGFTSGRSTPQLLKYLDMCIGKMMNESFLDTIYLYFAKAFDTVPHHRLIGKLESYGVSGNILNWIKAFLSERNQVVNVNGVDSESVYVLSGIPRGNVRSPILLYQQFTCSHYIRHFYLLTTQKYSAKLHHGKIPLYYSQI